MGGVSSRWCSAKLRRVFSISTVVTGARRETVEVQPEMVAASNADRGHEMFHDDMIMYAIINDQQSVIAMITRSSP